VCQQGLDPERRLAHETCVVFTAQLRLKRTPSTVSKVSLCETSFSALVEGVPKDSLNCFLDPAAASWRGGHKISPVCYPLSHPTGLTSSMIAFWVVHAGC